MIEILIGGDVCPIGRNLSYFRDGDANSLFNDLLFEFEKADLAIVNLECPLIDSPAPITKNGPILGVESSCINGLSKAKVDFVNLANNHILDHGVVGLLNTVNVCQNAGLSTVGAGKDLEAASKVVVRKVKGVRVGFLGLAENEFSIATKHTPGANSMDPIHFVRTMTKFRKEVDFLVVLVHSGLVDYVFPSPRLIETCRFLVEMGANAVVCQHSHCPGCYEEYEGSYIVYGQGNLVFDWNVKPDSMWNEGFLVKLSISGSAEHSMTIIPHIQQNGRVGVRKMTEVEGNSFLHVIKERSNHISNMAYIDSKWRQTCNQRKNDYYYQILFGYANHRILRFINRHFRLAERLFTKKHLLIMENFFKCESHREIVESIFEQRRKELTYG